MKTTLACTTAPIIISTSGETQIFAATMTDSAALDLFATLMQCEPNIDLNNWNMTVPQQCQEVTVHAWRDWTATRAEYNDSIGRMDLKDGLEPREFRKTSHTLVPIEIDTQEGGHSFEAISESQLQLKLRDPFPAFRVFLDPKFKYNTCRKTFQCTVEPTVECVVCHAR